MLTSEALALANPEPFMMARTRKRDITSKCGGCVFAKVEGHVQYGCKLGRIERWQELGVELKEENGFFIISRYCNTARNEDWGNAQTDDWIKSVYQEVAIKVACIVNLDDKNLDNALLTIKSLARQNPKPAQIVLVIRNRDIPPFQIMTAMRHALTGTGIKWCFEIMVDGSSYWEALDKGVSRTKEEKRFAIFQAGYKVPHNFFAQLDDSINRKMDRWLLLMPLEISGERYNGLVAMHSVYQSYGGFGTQGLVEKVNLENNEQKADMVKTYEELNG